MTCAEHDTLVLYLDGELEPEAQAAFQAHLDECDTCSHAHAVLSTLDGMLAEDEPLPLGLRSRLAAIPAADRRPSVWPRYAAAAAVLLAVGVLAFRLLPSTSETNDAARSPMADVVAPAPLSFEARVALALRTDGPDDRAWLDEVAPRAFAGVLDLTGDEDVAVARAAVRQLGRWRRLEALPRLRVALDLPELRRAAIVSIGRLASPRGVPVVARFLRDDAYADVAQRALVEIGGDAAARQLARAYDAMPRPELLRALADVGGPAAARVLVTRIATGTDGDRSALRAFRQGGPQLLRDAIALAAGSDEVSARAALRALEAAPPVEAVEHLVPLLQHRSRRHAAARVLARMDTEVSVRALLDARRGYELEPVFRLAGQGAEDVLLRELERGTRRERSRAARLLASCGGPRAVEALAKAASDRALAPVAIASIGASGAEGAVAALRGLAGDRRLRLEVIAALGATGREAAVPALNELAAAHPALRARVVDALSRIDAPQAVEAIVILDGRSRLRSQTTRALAAMEPDVVRRALVAMLDSQHGAGARHALSTVHPGPARSSRYMSAP